MEEKVRHTDRPHSAQLPVLPATSEPSTMHEEEEAVPVTSKQQHVSEVHVNNRHTKEKPTTKTKHESTPKTKPLDSTDTARSSNSSATMASTDLTTVPTYDKSDDGPMPMGKPEIWFRQNEWELTWPIWHMLPRNERKALAHQYGYKTIGEFEEFMSLQQAVDDTTVMQQNQTSIATAYNNELAYEQDASSRHMQDKEARNTHTKKPALIEDDHEDDDDSADNIVSKEHDMEKEQLAASTADDELTIEQLVKVGGLFMLLPDEILHRIFAWLPVDTYATLALVSPHWKPFTRTETVYKRLCERIYLQQSQRRALHVSRFNNSYRRMLEQRPRLRAGGGVYVMKFSRVKQIQRDMWTEVPMGAVLEMTYYRYLYFQEDGRVLYALSIAPPHEMFRRFLKMFRKQQQHQLPQSSAPLLRHQHEHVDEDDRDAVWGTYSIRKTEVLIEAKQSWQYVRLELSIRPEVKLHGRYGYMSFDKHYTSVSGNFDERSNDLVKYKAPEEPFRFVKDKRL